MSTAGAVNLKDPEALYLDWERAHWAARDVDLSRDQASWTGLDSSERDLLYFVLSPLMVEVSLCGVRASQSATRR